MEKRADSKDKLTLKLSNCHLPFGSITLKPTHFSGLLINYFDDKDFISVIHLYWSVR